MKKGNRLMALGKSQALIKHELMVIGDLRQRTVIRDLGIDQAFR